MVAALRGLHSPDVYDLKAYVPDIPDNFGFLLQAMVGPKGADGEESFDMLVCTPKWLCEHHDRSEIVVGRHHLIVFEYSYYRLEGVVSTYCAYCSGESWREIAAKLARLGKWEFEDYTSTPQE
jgi:hypothetical protein